MDIDKAIRVSSLVNRRERLVSAVLEMEADLNCSKFGLTTVTIDRTYLPLLIDKMKSDIIEIENAVELI